MTAQCASPRKLTGELREAYAPLVEDCCKAILGAISSNIAKLNSGTGTFFFSGVFFVSLTQKSDFW